MNGMTMHNLSNGWVDYQNRTCPNTVDFNSAIGGVKKDTEITGHNCGFESLKTLTPDLAYHSAGGVKAEYRCSYLSIESQICNSPGNKKGSTANATSLNCIFLKYQLNQSIHHSVNRWWRKVYPLGSMPRDCSSLRRTRLIHVASDVSPSFFISDSSCSLNSCGSRIWYWSVLVLSLDIVITTLVLFELCNYNVIAFRLQLKKQNPAVLPTLTGLLTTMLIEVTIMAMYKSTQTHPKFKWRFFSCQQSRYLTVEARSEQEARSMLPDAPCLFSARIRQGGNYA
ncbi:host cell division inhibitor Icd-like protein [Morganella morganii]|nr:host cell division inhibitor Icd-like protein [Morganella morganii]MCF1265186.1 host cell division inhibitor Icd-like protein [Morganella morganii]